MSEMVERVARAIDTAMECWWVRLAGDGDGGYYLDEAGARDLWKDMIDAVLEE